MIEFCRAVASCNDKIPGVLALRRKRAKLSPSVCSYAGIYQLSIARKEELMAYIPDRAMF